MAKQEIVEIAYQVDLSDLISAQAKKAGLSTKETKQLMNELKKRETASTRAIKKIESRQRRAALVEARAVKQATKDKIESFKKFGEAAQGEIGAVTGRVFALGEGIVKFAGAAGPLGIAGMAIAAFATGGVLAIGAVTGAMAATVLKADELNKEIKEFNNLGGFKGAVPPDQMKAIEEFNHQMKAVGVVFKQITVLLAGEFAPHLRNVGELMLKFVLSARDGLVRVAQSADLVQEGVVKIIKGLGILLTGPIGAVKLLGDMIVMVADATGKTNGTIEALRAGLQAVDNTVDGFIRSGVEGTFDAISSAVDMGSANLSKYDDEINKIFKTIKSGENKDAVKNAANDVAAFNKRLGTLANKTPALVDSFTKFQTAAEAGIATPVQAIQQQLDATLTSFDKSRNALAEQAERLQQSIEQAQERGAATQLLEEQQQTALDKLTQFENTRVQIIEAASNKVREIREQEQAAYDAALMQTANSVMGASKDIARFIQVQADAAKDGTEAQQRAARAAYAINQALAVSTITINTAQAIMQALASGPPPFSLIQAGAAGVAGAAQLATVVSTPPPSFHVGGTIGTSTSAPDEVMVRAKSGEGVLTGAGMKAIGGTAGLALANRGGMSGQEVVVVQKYQHRSFNAFQEDGVRMTNSPIRRAIKGQKKVGHRG